MDQALYETGLYDLQNLTDIESGDDQHSPVLKRAHSPEPFPSPVRKRSRKAKKKKRRVKLIDDSHTGFDIAQSTKWHLGDARVCSNGFWGQPSMLCPKRLIVPRNTLPDKHIKMLLQSGYKKVTLGYVNILPGYLHTDILSLSRLPTLMLDQGGTCIGVAAPPPDNPKLISEFTNELKSLLDYGLKPATDEGKRGDFEIIEHGIQMGLGIKVGWTGLYCAKLFLNL